MNVRVPEHRAKYILMAPAEQIREMSARQAKLVEMDLSPKPFPLGERGGNVEPPLAMPRITGRTSQEGLPTGTLARLKISVTNPSAEARSCEPIVLKGSLLAGMAPEGQVKGVRMDGTTVQWDDLDHNGFLSGGDEIAWQADLPPAGKARLHLGPAG